MWLKNQKISCNNQINVEKKIVFIRKYSITDFFIVGSSSLVLSYDLTYKKILSCLFIVIGILLISSSKSEYQKLTN